MATNPAIQPEQQAPQQTPQDLYGQNFENLPEVLQIAIWDIVCKQELEDSLPRLQEIRAITQRRLFFKGKQYYWWSETRNVWMSSDSPNAWLDEQQNMQQPAFQHVTNIYQASGLSIMTVLSQNSVAAAFAPKSAAKPIDVSTAKAGTKIVQMIHRNNDMQNKADDATYFMWNDGFLGGYVRFVSDGERFGWDEQPEMEVQSVEIAPAGINCSGPDCGSAISGATTDDFPICADCGSPMVQGPPVTADVPMPTGQTIQTPRGQEVISVIGALNLKRTMYAQEQCEFMYLTWITDLHKAQAKALYPQVADKIESSGGFGGNPSEAYEKLARAILYMGPYTMGTNWVELGTFRRVWLRPNSFERCKDDNIKAQLLTLFPKGCKAVFYNSVYCESACECMDEKWETMQSMPGEGQYRETLGSAVVPIQEQLNDCRNMIFEQGMFGTPEAFADKDTVDFEARSQQGAMPGNMSPVKVPANGDIREKIFFSQAVEPSEAMQHLQEDLMGPTLQFISGAFPALFGGDAGGNDTASGIAIQRNQALGRIGRAWRRLQVFWSNLDGKSVRCFAKNRTGQVEIPVPGPTGDYESDYVDIEDVQGEVTAFPEVDQAYPVLQSEISGLLMQLSQSPNPAIQAVITSADNIDYFFTRAGLSDIEIPGEQQRKKTYLVIDQLIKQKPNVVPPAPPPAGQKPMPGAAPPQPQVLPSIEPDPDVDNLEICKATAQKWLISDEGLKAMVENPNGYENVRAYLKACDQLNKAQQFKQAIATQGLQGAGPAADLGGTQDIQPPQPDTPQGSPAPSGGQ